MQEEYLHYLWRLKRLPLNDLKLTDGRTVELKNTGWYNLDAGPDFFNGTVLIDDIQWSGNIEMHIKSSDWYTHKHHLDPAYENVVLHVVLKHDKEVLINGEPIPTLELSDKIDRSHFKKYMSISNRNDTVPCSQNIDEVDTFIVHQQVNIALFQRLERKGNELLAFLNSDDQNRKKALLIALFQSFGGRVNKLPMIELAQIIPIDVLSRERWDYTRIESLVFGCAGFLNGQGLDEYSEMLQVNWQMLKSKYSLKEMNVSTWKFSGMRPFSFPTFRLAQLSALLFYWDLSFTNLTDGRGVINTFKKFSDKPVAQYWQNHFRLNVKSKKHNAQISKNTFNLVLINCIAPYFIYLKYIEQNFEYSDTALSILESIRSERNNVVTSWFELGIESKNAAESQGLIELKNEFCNFKKCLSCKIGHHILERDKKKTK